MILKMKGESLLERLQKICGLDELTDLRFVNAKHCKIVADVIEKIDVHEYSLRE